MSLAYVVVKLLAKMFIFINVGGHLGFRHLGLFSRPIKNAILSEAMCYNPVLLQLDNKICLNYHNAGPFEGTNSC